MKVVRRLFVFFFGNSRGDFDRIVGCEAGVAVTVWVGIRTGHGRHEALRGKVLEAVYAKPISHGIDVAIELVCKQLIITWEVHSVVARAHDGRRRNSKVYLSGSSISDHFDQLLAGRPSNDRIVDHYDNLILEDSFHGIKLASHFHFARILTWRDKRSSDVMIADQSDLVFAVIPQLLTLRYITKRRCV